jgi:anti-sigma factor RsiW
MMNHTDIQNVLFEGYDGELPPDTQSLITQHLTCCAECRGLLETWRLTTQKILTPLQTPDSERFVQNVMRAVRTQVLERPALFFRWAFPALALSMAGFAVTFLYIEHASPTASDTLVWGDQDTTITDGLSTPPTEDQILSAAVEKL